MLVLICFGVSCHINQDTRRALNGEGVRVRSWLSLEGDGYQQKKTFRFSQTETYILTCYTIYLKRFLNASHSLLSWE